MNLRRAAIAALALAVAGACSRVTPPRRTLPERIQTIALPMPRNESHEFGYQEELIRLMHEEFLADGQLQPVTLGRADARLDTTIRSITRQPQSFNRDDFRLIDLATISVDLTLWEPDREEPTLQVSGLTASQTFLSDPRRSQFASEPEWRERLLRNLSLQIVREVLSHRPDTETEREAFSSPDRRRGEFEYHLDDDADQTFPSLRGNAGRL